MSKKIHHTISTYKVTNHLLPLHFPYFKFIYEDDQIYHFGKRGEKVYYHQLDVLTICSVMYMQGRVTGSAIVGSNVRKVEWNWDIRAWDVRLK